MKRAMTIRTMAGTAGLLAFILASTASADISDQLKICADIDEASARLACFDAIGRTRAPDTPDAREPLEAHGSVPDSVATVPPAAAEVPKAPASAPAASETSNAPRKALDPMPPSPAEQRSGAASATEAADDFGMDSMTERERKKLEKESRKAEVEARKQAEKEAREEERNAVVRARIIDVRRHSDGRFSVTLENGQVWRETQGSRVGMPGEGAMVELKKGSFGGYRMNIDGLYRTAWVKRTK